MGESFALAAALLWAVSAFLFRAAGMQISPLILNAAKGAIAIVFLGGWIYASSDLNLSVLSPRQTGWLLLSGVVGIGVGDTAFFAALNRIGEQRAVLIAETVAPPLTLVLAFLWMAESISPLGCLGIAITIAGVTLGMTSTSSNSKASEKAASEKAASEKAASGPLQSRASRGVGLATVLALLAAICQSFGAVTSRWILSDTDISPIETSFVRMVGGQLILMVLMPIFLRRRNHPGKAKMPGPRTLSYLAAATMLGTVLGIVCQQASLKYTSAGISQTLIATSVLFVLPIGWMSGKKPTTRQCLAAAIGLLGVALLCLMR